MARRYFPFRYYDRDSLLHEPRDAFAVDEIGAALVDHGMRYGDSLFNIPPERQPAPGAPLRELDLLDMDALDKLLLVTRYPLTDFIHEVRKTLLRGFTTVEQDIHDVFARFFHDLSRVSVALAPWVAERLPNDRADLARIWLRQYGPTAALTAKRAPAGNWQKMPRDERSTFGYLLHLSHLWKGGPGLIAAFSMSGIGTLFWAHALRKQFAPLLMRPGFAIAQFEVPKAVLRPGNLREAGADLFRPEIVLSIPEEEFPA